VVGEPITLGWQVADWVETILRHGPGDVQGDEIDLDDEFAAVLVRAYRLNLQGRRLVRRYILSRAKGRAKSELAGMVVCAEALGPVRFDHWAAAGESSWWGYEYEKGEPVGLPLTYPFIRCLATEETQAGNTYDNVHYMLSDAVDAGRLDKIDVGLTRVFLPGGGEIVPSTAANSSKDGGKETFAVFDETHLYVLPQLRSMHGTVRRNLRKRKESQPWSLETTTMYEAGAESVAETTHRALTGTKPPVDVVFDHREGPDPEKFDWDNDGELLEALKAAYGPAAVWMDLPGIVSEIRDPETEKSDAIRFFLNRPSSTAADFVPLADWDKLIDQNAKLEPGDVICVGFDGSRGGDATGIVGVRASDGLTVKLGLWEREPGQKDYVLPRAAIHEVVEKIFADYTVVRWYGDPRYWETDHDKWANSFGSPPVMEIPQSTLRLWQAAARVVTLVRAAVGETDVEDLPGIVHTGDEDLRRHVGNARRERFGGRGSKDGRWKLDKKTPDRHIDLAVAATFAHEALGDAIKAGELDGPPEPFFL